MNDETKQESWKSFQGRVRFQTGKALHEIPAGEKWEMGTIFARRNSFFVVSSGYPDVDPETNEETWEEFRLLFLGTEEDLLREIAETDDPEELLRIAQLSVAGAQVFQKALERATEMASPSKA